MMESTIVIINLCGAVALLLFGLAQVKDGVQRAFGASLRSGLARGTSNGARSFVSGFVATIGLQSSTATALMVASFVERDFIQQRMAQIVLLGANVGTAVTAWIVATGIEWLSPLLILSGIVFLKKGTSNRRGIGTMLIGIGLMLLSLHLLGLATEPIRHSPAIASFVSMLNNAWPVALLFSAGIAFISSSSLAAVVLILSLGATGVLPSALLIVLVLGANLGGAIPPVIASMGGDVAAKRVTLGNLVVRGIGCLIALPFAQYGADLAAALSLPASKLPVDAHLAFNIILAVVAWPFSRLLSDMMIRLLPDPQKSDMGPKFLDVQQLSTPVMALAGATREVLSIGDLVERMLMRMSSAFQKNDPSASTDISLLEKRVDFLQQEVKVYLSNLGRQSLTEENGRRSLEIIDYAVNLEHIGDIVEKGLVPSLAKKAALGLHFSDDGFGELERLFDLTVDNIRTAQTIFATRDFHLAKRLMEIKIEVRRMEKLSSEQHLARLRDGRIESLRTSSIHLDMLRDLKRINAHIVSVAHPILEEAGLLSDSRLVSA
ncbi:phosphate:Na+ symporter [Brucella pseudogrignonensis]|uniref:Phosphate:Na+ symporter n=2 Tax=Brucella pseudogrignonensis TaxID=419475 RepID=A0ABU1MER6_9HYPH|nr:phosphate:Na+ symporter [Brucella pseudogrignonensis]